MTKGRLEAFSDGVLAIIITIMVLEIKVPHGASFSSLQPLVPVFISYVLSFVYVGIYWNNHHHLMQAVQNINGKVLWANLHLLFWLSLIPFASGWMGENHFADATTVAYGFVLLMCAVAYFILVWFLVPIQPKNSILAGAIKRDVKGKVSIVLYIVAIALSWVDARISILIYAVVAGIWFIPDKRIEAKMNKLSE